PAQHCFFFFLTHPPPISTLFPYTTLFRSEHDTFGEIRVPADRLWGAQTQRSLENFRISGERMPVELIRALALVKRSCARVNIDLDRKSTRLNSSHVSISYAVFCLKKKNKQ